MSRCVRCDREHRTGNDVCDRCEQEILESDYAAQILDADHDRAEVKP